MSASSRVHRQFHYTNDDGHEGFVSVSFGPWSTPGVADSPIMVDFEDAPWMGMETAQDFARWFRSALAEARRKH